MTKMQYRDDHKVILDSLLLKMKGVVPGKMFGYPAYYVDGRLFACLYENGVGVKVPAADADRLVGRKGIVRFQPLGRAMMKEWIQINREEPEHYLKDRHIFEKSIEFVSEGRSRNRKASG